MNFRPLRCAAARRKSLKVNPLGQLRGIVPLLLLSVALSVNSAQGSLVFVGLVPGGGAGIGTSNVVLTVHSGQDGLETGCVGWNGSTDVIGSAACPSTGISPPILGGDESTGSSQTQTRSVTDTGVLTAQYLTVILNANEPSGNAIQVENLVLTIYDSGGTLLWTSGNMNPQPINITNSNQGQGNLGFGFVLDSAQAAAADPYISCVTCASNRFGLGASLSNAQGSNETFSIVYVVPEPFTMLTAAAGLAALCLLGRYRRANAKG